MEFPKDLAADRPPNIVERYVEFIGRTEPDYTQELKRRRPRTPEGMAMRLGRGCMIATVKGDEAGADEIFGQVRARLEGQLSDPNWATGLAGRQAAQLLAMTTMLESRHDTAATLEARDSLHLSVVSIARLLRSSLTTRTTPPRGRKRAVLFGTLLETVTVAFATRLSDCPSLLGVPALLHHDRGQGSRLSTHYNYDMLLVRTADNRQGRKGHRIQVKTGCLGLCDNPLAAEKQIRRDRYVPDITFLASCCDLGVRREQNDRLFDLARVFVKDVQGKAAPADLLDLDALTSSVLLAVASNDPRRRGTYGLVPPDVPIPVETEG